MEKEKPIRELKCHIGNTYSRSLYLTPSWVLILVVWFNLINVSNTFIFVTFILNLILMHIFVRSEALKSINTITLFKNKFQYKRKNGKKGQVGFNEIKKVVLKGITAKIIFNSNKKFVFNVMRMERVEYFFEALNNYDSKLLNDDDLVSIKRIATNIALLNINWRNAYKWGFLTILLTIGIAYIFNLINSSIVDNYRSIEKLSFLTKTQLDFLKGHVDNQLSFNFLVTFFLAALYMSWFPIIKNFLYIVALKYIKVDKVRNVVNFDHRTWIASSLVVVLISIVGNYRNYSVFDNLRKTGVLSYYHFGFHSIMSYKFDLRLNCIDCEKPLKLEDRVLLFKVGDNIGVRGLIKAMPDKKSFVSGLYSLKGRSIASVEPVIKTKIYFPKNEKGFHFYVRSKQDIVTITEDELMRSQIHIDGNFINFKEYIQNKPPLSELKNKLLGYDFRVFNIKNKKVELVDAELSGIGRDPLFKFNGRYIEKNDYNLKKYNINVLEESHEKKEPFIRYKLSFKDRKVAGNQALFQINDSNFKVLNVENIIGKLVE